MIYGIEYYKYSNYDKAYYMLPVTFTAMHDKYAAIKRFEHIVKCLQNTKNIKYITVVDRNNQQNPNSDEFAFTVAKAYYEYNGGLSHTVNGSYMVALKEYETNPYF